MDNTICYAYSKRNGFVTMAVLLVLAMLFVANIVKAYYAGDKIDMIVFILLTAALVLILVILVISRLRPALRGHTALEFNKECIVDYVRNITIEWKDIKGIDFKRTRSSAMLAVQIKWESDYGSKIFISLRWVAGSDREIYKSALAYLANLSGTDTWVE